MNNELFDLKVGDISFKNPIALGPMAGITDSNFANKYAKNAGLVILGGFNLDEETNEAASRMAERDRKEYVTDNPLEFLKDEINNTNTEGAVAANIRSATLEPLLEAAEIIKNADAILELDAHCRQKEMIDIGVGEALMHDIPRLVEWIEKLKETGVILSVKIRANVVDDIELSRKIESAGADILHVDATLEGKNKADLKAIRKIRDSVRMTLIGNNSITEFSDAKDMFSRGVNLVSVSRGVLDNHNLIDELVEGVTDFQEKIGWYNAPKHICAGEGDLRGLTFCCLPIKPCAVQNKLKKLGITPEEFKDLKMEFAKGTKLEFGDSTCFGSLVWCCKLTKFCPIRDGVLYMLDMSGPEYMQLKKELANYILENANIPVNETE
ncbi:MAG: methanogenesis marker 9 domain-containing protein [Methanohalobium sp.]|uniref:methanogenesis marker 9 domain-containing protein n=1 Tax=Methanohalobium sp. TaxID=2837493 RepID=UPI003978CD49